MNTRLRAAMVGLLPILVWCAGAEADIINVPADAPTIQAGIDLAVDGDEVVLADGAYFGDGNTSVSFLGKSITVRSANGPQMCSIDGAGADQGFEMEGDTEMTLRGLTIRATSASFGAALRCIGVTATVADCRFEFNVASWRGGAIHVTGGSLTLESCSLLGNIASSDGGSVAGGAVFAEDAVVDLTDTQVEGNSASTPYSYGGDAVGGGLATYECTVTMQRGELKGNATSGGEFLFSCGGGIFCSGGSLEVIDVTCESNFATGWSSAGGAICASAPVVTRCVFRGNSADGGGSMGGGGSGGALAASTATITDSSFCDNTAFGSPKPAGGGGGALSVSPGTLVDGCVFRRNAAWSVGPKGKVFSPSGAIAGSGFTLADSAFCGNDAGDVSGGFVDGGRVVFAAECDAGSSSSCASCAGDVNGGGSSNFEDLLLVLAAWGPCDDCREDIDRDGNAGFSDVLIVLSQWGPCS